MPRGPVGDGGKSSLQLGDDLGGAALGTMWSGARLSSRHRPGHPENYLGLTACRALLEACLMHPLNLNKDPIWRRCHSSPPHPLPTPKRTDKEMKAPLRKFLKIPRLGNGKGGT